MRNFVLKKNVEKSLSERIIRKLTQRKTKTPHLDRTKEKETLNTPSVWKNSKTVEKEKTTAGAVALHYCPKKGAELIDRTYNKKIT